MKRLVFATFATLALAGCGPMQLADIPASPSEAADRTVLDEKAGIAIETAYTAAAEAARLAIIAEVVTPAQAERIAVLDRQAYAIVQQTRAAYDAGNAASYEAAAAQALPILRELVAAIQE